MRDRIAVLKDLIQLDGRLSELQNELSKFPWDVEIPLIVMTRDHFLEVIEKCLGQHINFLDLENWANAIECRDDIDFEEERIKEIIFELASPEINGEITEQRLNEFKYELGALS
ncbi:hypothetical protein [Allomuricauda sp. SCSIO 65647]|uniref:hypothetical protein n=1 Tax=Allomuricauda sp. SCSIO 65647 TaxID=2908843 RepID=UPI001F4621DC|nr:hypothetical protein [Muricauda sp. SCSIO 65647]UJH66386.1 hypothetical protein L0P89_10445 [Muricauda sp. SCSIO 65647]